MTWLNLNAAVFLRSPEFLGCSPAQNGVWLRLVAYCVLQENGGTIKDCAAWGTRRWEQIIGVTLEEIQDQCELWKWDGHTLAVLGYPAAREAQEKAGREGGSLGGRPRKKQPATPSGNTDTPPENPQVSNHETLPKTPSGNTDNPPENPKGIERKGKEWNGSQSQDATDGQISFSTLTDCLSFCTGQGIAAEAATAWWLKHSARGWKDESGEEIRNRPAACLAWCRGWAVREKNAAAPPLQVAPAPPPEPEGWKNAVLAAGYDIDPDVQWSRLPAEVKAIAINLLAA